MSHRKIAWSVAILLMAALGIAAYRSATSPSENFLGGPMLQRGDADGKTEIYVVWRTPEATDSKVQCRRWSNEPFSEVYDPTPTKHHSVKLTGLSPAATYHYTAYSGGVEIGGGNIRLDYGRHFRFVVFGDSGSGSRDQYAVAQEIGYRNPDFILHTGDLIYPSGEDKDYPKQFFSPYKTLIASAVFYPAIGNHDYSKGSESAWAKNFVLPGKELYYRFDYGNADFIALDSNNVTDESVTWLDEELAKCEKDWKIVFFHHPPYSNARSGSGDTPRGGHDRARELWLPVMRKHGVDLVLCGHDHMYTRFRQTETADAKDPIVVVEGCGGKSVRQGILSKEAAVTDDKRYGFGMVDVQGKTLHFRHITADGETLDYFSITK